MPLQPRRPLPVRQQVGLSYPVTPLRHTVAMHFTVSFSGPEHLDLSFGLVFVPCPVWVQGHRELLNLHPQQPQLQPGAVGRLRKLPECAEAFASAGTRVAVIAHSGGNGTPEDLAVLVDDLRLEGFQVTPVDLASAGAKR